MLTTAFAAYTNVFVLPLQENLSLCLSVADAVFTPAFAIPVCAAARMDKIVILLHTPASRARLNVPFLDSRGIAFCGKTAADNVSFACRLLDGQRLRGIMHEAQSRYMICNAENRLAEAVEKIEKPD